MPDAFSVRFPCCVCGDPWTLEAPDYVELLVLGPNGEQRLGAHSACLNRFLTVRVEVGADED